MSAAKFSNLWTLVKDTASRTIDVTFNVSKNTLLKIIYYIEFKSLVRNKRALL